VVAGGSEVAQRFLLSAAARTLSLRSIYAEGERAAYRRFCALRWPETSGRPVCPACGCLDVYDLRTRQRFKCAACHRQFVAPGSVITADEVAHWDLLMADFVMRRINHSEAYSRDGAHTNHAESFFPRPRRMIGGQHHKISVQHLGAHAVHAAWLEDHRDRSNGALADRLLARALAVPVSRGWKGYWQRPAA
jgi:hypothetical protein